MHPCGFFEIFSQLSTISFDYISCILTAFFQMCSVPCLEMVTHVELCGCQILNLRVQAIFIFSLLSALSWILCCWILLTLYIYQRSSRSLFTWYPRECLKYNSNHVEIKRIILLWSLSYACFWNAALESDILKKEVFVLPQLQIKWYHDTQAHHDISSTEYLACFLTVMCHFSCIIHVHKLNIISVSCIHG